MLNVVTEQRPGEPDVLSAVKYEAFEIRSLAGDVLKALLHLQRAGRTSS